MTDSSSKPQLPPTTVFGLTLPKLVIGIYAVGYFAYLIPALVWAWRADVPNFLGFVLWQGILYGSMWPLILFVQFERLVVGTL